MGYVREPRVYKLMFADPGMAGLEVKARSVSFGEYREILRLSDAPRITRREEIEAGGQLLERFAEVLVSWNLETPDGARVPTTVEGLESQDTGFLFTIINAWLEAVAGVPDPKEPSSSSGDPSLEASLPMEVSSENQ